MTEQQLAAEPPTYLESCQAYTAIDRFLRNNLDDTDYAEYSALLDVACCIAPPPVGDGEVKDMVRQLRRVMNGFGLPGEAAELLECVDRERSAAVAHASHLETRNSALEEQAHDNLAVAEAVHKAVCGCFGCGGGHPDDLDLEAIIASATGKPAERDCGMTLSPSDVGFLAARVRRLCDTFGHKYPAKEDDEFIVGVAGSIIGSLLTNLELKQPAANGVPDDVAKDAARYRWLRSPTQDVGNVIDKQVVEGVWEYRAGDELDSAIDAAMLAAAPKLEGGR